jgi:hypothetical protein
MENPLDFLARKRIGPAKMKEGDPLRARCHENPSQGRLELKSVECFGILLHAYSRKSVM